MDAFERQVRATAIQTLRDTGEAPTAEAIAGLLAAEVSRVSAALNSLADEHRLVLVPGTDRVMMAHPFSGVASDLLVTIGERRRFANCVWDGLSILALLGDGTLETHSPATGEPITFTARDGVVEGDALVTPQTLYDLGREWYATRLDIDWQPVTAAEATVMFAAHGLVEEFWSLM